MVRFGIIGAGNIAHQFAQDINVVPNATLVAVASRSLDKAQAFQKEYHVEYAFDNYEDMVSSNLIDAVYVATPHNFHEEHTILSLEHDKHVLCEKPLAVNIKQATNMFQVAKKNNKLLMEALWTRYLPAMNYVKDKVTSNTLGDIVSMDITFGFQMGDRLSETGRILNPALAGGGLLDLGVYNVSMLKLISKDPVMNLHVEPEFASTGVDLHLVITGHLDNRQQTHFRLETAVNQALANEAVLRFEDGTLVIPNFWSTQTVIDNGIKKEFPHKSRGFEYEIEHFSNSVEQGLLEDPVMTKEETMAVMQMLDDIRASIGMKYPFEE